MIFIKEGHYVNGNDEFMSIWTYKNVNGIYPNDRERNYEDAKAIQCSDRHWKPFNASREFKAGWHYNVECLDIYFKKR